MTVTAIFTLVTSLCKAISKWMKTHEYVHWIALISGLALLISLLCFKKLVRKVPINYILLATFTVIWSYMVAGFSSYTDPKIVLVAAVCSAAMFIGLTTVACLVKAEKLGYCWSLLSVFSSLIVPGIIFMIIYRSKYIHICVIMVCILVFSLYIIYDTKRIMLSLSVDEYIIGSLLIYVDFIQLCMCLVTLLGINN